MVDKRDYKKEYRDLYQPGKRPSLVDVPPIPMFLVDGAGDPSGAAYQAAMSALYTVTFTLKMSRLGPWQPEGYFDYVLPPLEGFWWTEEGGTISSPCPDPPGGGPRPCGPRNTPRPRCFAGRWRSAHGKSPVWTCPEYGWRR